MSGGMEDMNVLDKGCGGNCQCNHKAAKEGEGMISIPKAVYDELVEDQKFLDALVAAGVDNWDGYDYAQELMDEG